LLSLVATCSPALARQLVSRGPLAKFSSALLERSTRARHVCSLSSTHPFSIVRTIRDPRDVIISGYHHHRGCPKGEPWLHQRGGVASDIARKQDALGASMPDVLNLSQYGADAANLTYCELLNRVPERVGIAIEIVVSSSRWLAGLMTFLHVLRYAPELGQWVHLVRYEDMWDNLEGTLPMVAERLFPDEFDTHTQSSMARGARRDFEQTGLELTKLKWKLAFSDQSLLLAEEGGHTPDPHNGLLAMQPSQQQSSDGAQMPKHSTPLKVNRTGVTAGLKSELVLRNMRKGSPGQWRSTFRYEHIRLFNLSGLDVLVDELAYD